MWHFGITDSGDGGDSGNGSDGESSGSNSGCRCEMWKEQKGCAGAQRVATNL